MIARVARRTLGAHQTAAVRIGVAGTWLLFLLREWPHRHELYGPDGPWSWELARLMTGGTDAFTVLLWSDGRWWFETCYLLALLSAAALMLGWRTRASSVLFAVGVLSLQNRSVLIGDGGDNVLHIMALYLVFTRCATVWSLDARRARRARPGVDAVGVALWTACGAVLVAACGPGPLEGGRAAVLWLLWAVQGVWWVLGRRPHGEPRAVADAVANVVHNAALLVVMVEVCLIYATAGWYKVQGTRWQDGTAAYFPLQVDHFRPWPALADLVSGHGVLVLVVTYATVAVQVAFPFTVFHRPLKNALLVFVMLEHLSIAVLLGLPFFSLAMLAADAVFLPHSFFRRTERELASLRGRVASRPARPRPAAEPGESVSDAPGAVPLTPGKGA